MDWEIESEQPTAAGGDWEVDSETPITPARTARRGGTAREFRQASEIASGRGVGFDDPRRVDRAPAPLAKGESVLDRPVPGYQPSQADLEWQSLSPQGQAKVIDKMRYDTARANAGEMRAVEEPGIARKVLDSTIRKPLDNSLSGLALETAGDAARGVGKASIGLGQSAWGAVEAGADAVGADRIGDFAAGANRGLEGARNRLTNIRDPNSITESVFESTFTSLPVVLAAPGAPLTAVMGQVAAKEYGSSRAKGLNGTDSAERAVYMGLAEGLGERFGMPQLQSLFAKAAGKATGKEMGHVLADLLVKEQVGEQVTQLLQSGYEKVGRVGDKPDMTLDQYLDEAVQTAKVTLGQSLLTGGMAGGVRAAAPAMQLKTAQFAQAFAADTADRSFTQDGIDAAVRGSLSPNPDAISPVETARPTPGRSLAAFAEDMTGQPAAPEPVTPAVVAPTVQEMPTTPFTPEQIAAMAPPVEAPNSAQKQGVMPQEGKRQESNIPIEQAGIEGMQPVGIATLPRGSIAAAAEARLRENAQGGSDARIEGALGAVAPASSGQPGLEPVPSVEAAGPVPADGAGRVQAAAAGVAQPGPAGVPGGVRPGGPDAVAADAGQILADYTAPQQLQDMASSGQSAALSKDSSSRRQGVAMLNEVSRRKNLKAAAPRLVAAIAPMQQAMRELSGSTTLVPYSDNSPTAADGFSEGRQFFVNLSKPQKSIPMTAWHEFTHVAQERARQAVIRQEAGEALSQEDQDHIQAQQLLDKVWDSMAEKGKRRYAEKYLAKGMTLEQVLADPAASEGLRFEMQSDFMGRRATDRKFLEGLAEQHPTLFGGFIRSWIRVLDTLIGAFKGGRADSGGVKNVDRYLGAHLKEARKVAGDVLALWSGTGRPAATPAPGATPAAAQQTTTPQAQAPPIAGDKIDGQWTSFAEDSGTLGIPRAEMPQIKAEHRGAMVNFLNARGIAHEQDEIDADQLKPTQAEFSESKVAKAKAYEGGNRSILVSKDNHVLDGHHQWMAAREAGEPIKVIRLDAPIKQLLETVKEFPSAGVSSGANVSTTKVESAPDQNGAQDGQGQAAAGTEARELREPGGIRGSDGVLAGPRRPYQGPGQAGTTLEGLPRTVRVDGQEVEFGGFKPAQDAARAYMRKAGMEYTPPTSYAKVDEKRAGRIADAFEQMRDEPQNPEVKAAYAKMIEETAAQYQAILDTGLEIEFIDGADPYGNPRKAILDVVENNHLWVFSTSDGFGSSDHDASQNPMLATTQFTISGKPALVNDLFRVVHDYFGHIKEGVGFRTDGEENAWRLHSAMYSPLARRAMTTETRGQNSWVNFGPNSKANKTAGPADTVYADQKVGLLPDWVVNDGSGQPKLSRRELQPEQQESGAAQPRNEYATVDPRFGPGYKRLDGRTVKVDVRLADTGEVVGASFEADALMRDLDDRESVIRDLIACL